MKQEISAKAYQILQEIARGAYSYREICDNVPMSRGSVSSNLRVLVAKGYVEAIENVTHTSQGVRYVYSIYSICSNVSLEPIRTSHTRTLFSVFFALTQNRTGRNYDYRKELDFF